MKLQEKVDPGAQMYRAEQEHVEQARPGQRGPEFESCQMAETMSSPRSIANLAHEADPFPDTQNELKRSINAGWGAGAEEGG